MAQDRIPDWSCATTVPDGSPGTAGLYFQTRQLLYEPRSRGNDDGGHKAGRVCADNHPLHIGPLAPHPRGQSGGAIGLATRWCGTVSTVRMASARRLTWYGGHQFGELFSSTKPKNRTTMREKRADFNVGPTMKRWRSRSLIYVCNLSAGFHVTNFLQRVRVLVRTHGVPSQAQIARKIVSEGCCPHMDQCGYEGSGLATIRAEWGEDTTLGQPH